MTKSQGRSAENNTQTPVGNSGGQPNNSPLPDLNMPPDDLDAPEPNNMPVPNANTQVPGLNAHAPNNPAVMDFNAPAPSNPLVPYFEVPGPSNPPLPYFDVPGLSNPLVPYFDLPGPSNPLVPYFDVLGPSNLRVPYFNVPGPSNPLVPYFNVRGSRNPPVPYFDVRGSRNPPVPYFNMPGPSNPPVLFDIPGPSNPPVPNYPPLPRSLIMEEVKKYYGLHNVSEYELINILTRDRNIDPDEIAKSVFSQLKRRYPEIYRAYERIARHELTTNLGRRIQGASAQSSASNFLAPPAVGTSGNNSDDLGGSGPVVNTARANNNSPDNGMRSSGENRHLPAPLPDRDSCSTDDRDSTAPADG